ncbi:ABC-2 type transport system ATP-binding protein [Paenibacillaceae bacterium GAS479]|nr:ABC-2 type transport system ATP-binding protein [Paenibacillaceae bacterium GAS479]
MTALSIRGLACHVEHTTLFPAVNIEAAPGEVLAIYSTMNVRHVLMAMLAGSMPIHQGEIRIGEYAPSDRKRASRLIGFMRLDEGLYERLTVKENFSFYRDIYGSSVALEEVLRVLKLDQKADHKLVKLTSSEKRRVQYGRLLLQNSELLVFEEPDQNVDIETKLVFHELVRSLSAKGKMVLILTGSMETALSATSQVCRLDDKGLHVFDIQEKSERDAEQLSGFSAGRASLELNKKRSTPDIHNLGISEMEIGLSQQTIAQEIVHAVADEPVASLDVDNASSSARDRSETEESNIGEESVFGSFRFEKIPTRVNDKIILFNPPEIDYIESSEGQSNLYVNGEMYASAFKINELEVRLQSCGFFRCHRSYLVNLQKVKEVITYTRNSYSLVLDDQSRTHVPLSKTKMAELKEMMGLK